MQLIPRSSEKDPIFGQKSRMLHLVCGNYRQGGVLSLPEPTYEIKAIPTQC